MLDYKIKELKRDIAPREMEITRLKKETNEMDKNLKHYNKLAILVSLSHTKLIEFT